MKDKKTIILTIIGVLAFILVVIGATYAYYVKQGEKVSTSDLEVKASTTDSFILKTGSAISLEINQTNFASGAGNVSGSTYASATLTANNKTNTATEYYYLYLNITKNELVYTTEDKKTELLLTVTDNNGNAITSINGLTYDSTLGGFDITEASGTIAILDNREITVEESNTTHQTVDYWNITITMINLDTDQTDNAGKEFKASIKITKEKFTLANYITSLYTADGEDGLYYHDGTGTYGAYEAGDNSYRYSGTDPDNYVCFGDDCTNYDNLYRIIGVFGDRVKLIKADFANTDLLGTGQNNGTYTASSYTNYKGSKTTIDRYYWSGSSSNSSNTWSSSTLNTTALNTTYLTNLGTTWQNYIDDTTWIVGGNTYANIETTAGVKNVYTSEIVNPALSTTYTAKIGLMYVSEYMYGADPTQADSWNSLMGYNSSSSLDFRAVINYNWMYSGIYEWTITHNSSLIRAFYVDSTGFVGSYYVDDSGHTYGVRPSFSLKSSVGLAGGTGTASDPYRIG